MMILGLMMKKNMKMITKKQLKEILDRRIKKSRQIQKDSGFDHSYWSAQGAEYALEDLWEELDKLIEE